MSMPPSQYARDVVGGYYMQPTTPLSSRLDVGTGGDTDDEEGSNLAGSDRHRVDRTSDANQLGTWTQGIGDGTRTLLTMKKTRVRGSGAEDCKRHVE